jgi:hypothetical protein
VLRATDRIELAPDAKGWVGVTFRFVLFRLITEGRKELASPSPENLPKLLLWSTFKGDAFGDDAVWLKRSSTGTSISVNGELIRYALYERIARVIYRH